MKATPLPLTLLAGGLASPALAAQSSGADDAPFCNTVDLTAS